MGGKWKVLIIHAIGLQYNHFSLLQKVLPVISKQMLVNQLRELEKDGLIQKTKYTESPPRIEYNITSYGNELMPLITLIQQWGLEDMKRNK